MHQGKYVFSQLMEFVPRFQFDQIINQYHGNKGVRGFSCYQQFLCMSFGQLTHRESLRDVVICLSSQTKRLYHLGFNSQLVLTTLTRANANRDWRIYRDLAQILTNKARELYRSEPECDFEFAANLYALDSTTIDLCLSVFKWASFKRTKAAIKLHTLLDLKNNLPIIIKITNGKVSDVSILDQLKFEAKAFYIVDRGYFDCARLSAIDTAEAFFVIRGKVGLNFQRIYSSKVDKESGVICDQTIRFAERGSAKRYPNKLRRIKYRDAELGKVYVFLTNSFSLEAKTIADFYKHRWQIELFFKWIKQHLRLKSFWGESQNAVHTQIWIAICSYALVAIVRKKLGIQNSLYEVLQILSISLLDKTSLKELFCKDQKQIQNSTSLKQLKLREI